MPRKNTHVELVVPIKVAQAVVKYYEGDLKHDLQFMSGTDPNPDDIIKFFEFMRKAVKFRSTFKSSGRDVLE